MRRTHYKGNKKFLLFLLHVCAWLLLVYYVYSFASQDSQAGKILYTSSSLLPYCFAFYGSLYFLIIYKEISPLISVAAFLLVFAVTHVLATSFFYTLPLLSGPIARKLGSSFISMQVVVRFLFFFLLAVVYRIVLQSAGNKKEVVRLQQGMLEQELKNMKLKEKENQLQQEKMQLQLEALRNQLPAHFLYNVLNLLVVQAVKYSEELSDNLVRLSGILRYSMENIQDDNNIVPLQKELDHLQLLIAINQQRFEAPQPVAYSVEGDTGDSQVPRLSLITIAENAFKYADLKDPEHPLLIQVRVNGNAVNFLCRNKKHQYKNMASFNTLTSQRIGIANLQQQLDLCFKEKYKLQAKDEEEFYTLELIIRK